MLVGMSWENYFSAAINTLRTSHVIDDNFQSLASLPNGLAGGKLRLVVARCGGEDRTQEGASASDSGSIGEFA